jgi:hypothetical protein
MNLYTNKQNEMKTLGTINAHNPKRAQQDKRYRREYSGKTFSSTKGQRVNRYKKKTDELEHKYGYSIDRSRNRHNERKQARLNRA